ncbi:hypothetical protein TUBRATIS_21010 [Tubulinosema ratisbonensis]|uniref:Rad21/Rec8-like protein N-terminal domain-containing protein n=1 Tax=Tubulinosema ratisbonensis TaxID=291195 RepID=A0A437AIF4_9MICR|nr:hypothetical protein TUBRATIS_27120 [Tubulinosema ratisbonensis]RVD91448.1 hypothetical protein TUBRATIS_21010 [Tubulinosema ratisbonensis]
MVNLENTNTLINFAWLSFYTPKKITKKLFKTVNLVSLIKTIKQSSFRLPIISKLMSGVMNVYYNKTKIIYEECVNIVSLPQPKRQKVVHTYPINKIELEKTNTKNILLDSSNINSTLLNNPLINTNLDSSFVMEPSSLNYSLELGDNFIDSNIISNSLEQLREETLVKERKEIIDTNLDIKFNRKRVKLEKNEREIPLIFKLFDDHLTNQLKEVNESSLELERGNSMVDPVFYDFDDLPNENSSEKSLFSITNLPNEFIFNDVIDCFDRKERIKCFSKLIELANKGSILIEQKEMYEEIYCKIN